MRPSPLRTPLAVLRSITGLAQKELADFLECKLITYQAAELGRRPLTEDLASRISIKTGVNLTWLLGGNPTAAVLDEHGRPYTAETFARFREWSGNKAERSELDQSSFPGGFAFVACALHELLRHAAKEGKLRLFCGLVMRSLRERVESNQLSTPPLAPPLTQDGTPANIAEMIETLQEAQRLFAEPAIDLTKRPEKAPKTPRRRSSSKTPRPQKQRKATVSNLSAKRN